MFVFSFGWFHILSPGPFIANYSVFVLLIVEDGTCGLNLLVLWSPVDSSPRGNHTKYLYFYIDLLDILYCLIIKSTL